METISFEYCGEGDVATTARLAVWTFANVTNAGEVRAALLSGELDCAVMNARAVAGMACLKLAAYRAIVARARGALVTRAVHSELVFSLSPNGTSARRLSIGATRNQTRSSCANLTPRMRIRRRSQTPCAGTAWRSTRGPRWMRLRCESGTRCRNELELGSLEDAVLSRIAIRDVI